MNEALLRVITVEPDGSYAYVTGYEDLSDRAKAKFSIWRLKLAPGKGNSKVEDFSKAGRKIRVYDGNAQFPENASVEDREVMNIPLRSLAILGSTLYATDALKGRVLLYDKESGELKKEFPVPLACGIALDPNGRIWVGHEHEKVSVLSAGRKSPGHAHHRLERRVGTGASRRQTLCCRPGAGSGAHLPGKGQ